MKHIRLILLSLLCLGMGTLSQRAVAQYDDLIIDIDLGDSWAEPAQMISPVNGSTFTTSTVAFQWTTGNSVAEYWLRMGTTSGGRDLVEQSMGLATSATVSPLPINGRPIYVTLFSKVNGDWQSYTYTYATAGKAGTSGAAGQVAAARMISPADGSTLSADSVIFQWTPVAGAQRSWLYVGTSREGYELFNSSMGSATSVIVPNLPRTGQPIFVKLWTKAPDKWLTSYHQYTAASQNSGSTTSGTVNLAPGLIYDYFETADYLTSVTQLDRLTTIRRGQAANFDTSNRTSNRNDKYAFRFGGFLAVSTPGTYTFFTNSDDGSQLWIGGHRVVDNDGAHGPEEKSGEVQLAAGYYEIIVTYFQTYGAHSLQVSWAGPGLAKQVIPNDRLFHR